MVKVFRNHCHGSAVIVSEFVRDNTSFFRKSSYSRDGIENLKREYEGYKWYCEKRISPIKLECLNLDDKYFELCIEMVHNDLPLKRDLSYKNVTHFCSSIDHYQDVWNGASDDYGLYPIHGDFSLDGNILFVEGSVFIIDWEHFHYKGAPLGFDVLFMIFEGLKLSIGNKFPSIEDIELVNVLVEYAKSNGALDECFFGKTFKKFLEVQSKITHVWGRQITKIPTFQFSIEQINYISRLIKS